MILFFILFLSRLIKWLSAINHDWSFYAHNSIISFFKWGEFPFYVTLVREDFYIWGVEGGILWHFSKIYIYT